MATEKATFCNVKNIDCENRNKSKMPNNDEAVTNPVHEIEQLINEICDETKDVYKTGLRTLGIREQQRASEEGIISIGQSLASIIKEIKEHS